MYFKPINFFLVKLLEMYLNCCSTTLSLRKVLEKFDSNLVQAISFVDNVQIINLRLSSAVSLSYIFAAFLKKYLDFQEQEEIINKIENFGFTHC